MVERMDELGMDQMLWGTSQNPGTKCALLSSILPGRTTLSIQPQGEGVVPAQATKAQNKEGMPDIISHPGAQCADFLRQLD